MRYNFSIGSDCTTAHLSRASGKVPVSIIQFVCYIYRVSALARGTLATSIYVKQDKVWFLYYLIQLVQVSPTLGSNLVRSQAAKVRRWTFLFRENLDPTLGERPTLILISDKYTFQRCVTASVRAKCLHWYLCSAKWKLFFFFFFPWFISMLCFTDMSNPCGISFPQSKTNVNSHDSGICFNARV